MTSEEHRGVRKALDLLAEEPGNGDIEALLLPLIGWSGTVYAWREHRAVLRSAQEGREDAARRTADEVAAAAAAAALDETDDRNRGIEEAAQLVEQSPGRCVTDAACRHLAASIRQLKDGNWRGER